MFTGITIRDDPYRNLTFVVMTVSSAPRIVHGYAIRGNQRKLLNIMKKTSFSTTRLTIALTAAFLSLPALAHEGHAHQVEKHAAHHVNHHHAHAKSKAHQAMAPRHAVANMKPTAGSTTEGHIQFDLLKKERIHIHGLITGLAPNSLHGFHVHEKGDCSAPDASSAGGHFHLPGQQHGDPSNPHDHHHAGDMGNVKADAHGVAKVDLMLSQHQMTLGHAPQNIVGRAVVVHKGADDLHSQPAGDSGGRAACGVIELTR